MHKESQKYTAFMTNKGLYEFIKMPFGPKRCPATFNKLMCRLLGHREDCFFYDIIIFPNIWEDHMTALYEIFDI